jgi:hypothetical protein
MSLKVYKPIKGREDKIVVMNEENCLTGKYENGWFKTESKSFGVFSIAYDTIAPTISFPQPKKKNASSNSILSFKVTDTQSGVAEYHIYLNDVWQIAEYDAKSSTIFCDVNGKTGTLKIEITDRVGNKTVVKKEF